jgi:hypothetical protein
LKGDQYVEKISVCEQEAIINFNKAEDIATIFTYEKTWQKQLESRLGLKPVMDNGFDRKAYELPKKRIKPPRVPRPPSNSAGIRIRTIAERAKHEDISRARRV